MPSRIFSMLIFGVALSFLIVGSGSALKSSIGDNFTNSNLAIDKDSYQLLALTNSERQASGLSSLKLNNFLEQSARSKCSDMVTRNYWGHVTPDGKNVSTFINRAGIRNFHKAGENLALGQSSLAQANHDWMNSPSHKANILDKDYTDVGFGLCVYTSNSPELEPLNIYVEHFLDLN